MHHFNVKSKKKYIEIKSKVFLYFKLLIWILKDIFQLFPLRVIKVTTFYTVGVTSGASVIGFIFLYIRHFSQGEAMGIGNIIIPIPHGEGGIAIAFYITLLGCAAAACSYFSEWAIVDLVVDYQCYCQHRLFQLITKKNNIGWAFYLRGPARSGIINIYQQTFFLGRVSRILLRSVWPILTSIISISSLIILSYQLTLVLLPISIAYSIPLYKTSIYAARSKHSHSIINIEAKDKVHKLTQSIIDASLLRENLHEVELQLQFHQQDYIKVSKSAFSRLLLSLHTEFFNNILLMTGIFCLFSFAILQSQHPEWSWSQFILYVISFRFVITGLRSVTSNLIIISRLIPDIRNYIEFVSKIQHIESQIKAKRKNKIIKLIKLYTYPSLIKSQKKEVTLHLPATIGLLLPYTPQVADLQGIIKMLEARSKHVLNKNNVIFLDKVNFNPNYLKTKLQSISRREKSLLVLAQKKIGICSHARSQLKELLSGKDEFSRKLLLEEKILWENFEILLSPPEVIFVESKLMQKIDQEVIEKIFKISPSLIIVVVYKEIESFYESIKNRKLNYSIIYNAHNEIITIGSTDWIKHQEKEIKFLWDSSKHMRKVHFEEEEEEE